MVASEMADRFTGMNDDRLVLTQIYRSCDTFNSEDGCERVVAVAKVSDLNLEIMQTLCDYINIRGGYERRVSLEWVDDWYGPKYASHKTALSEGFDLIDDHWDESTTGAKLERLGPNLPNPVTRLIGDRKVFREV
jgi:hypothetical protein